MESPNAEYKAAGAANKLEHLSDQYKSMRDLLKVYGLSVAPEENNNPPRGKSRVLSNTIIITIPPAMAEKLFWRRINEQLSTNFLD